MRLIDVFATANSNILRSKLRTSLTVVAITIGAFTLTLTTGLGSGISSYIDKQVNNLGAKDILIITPLNSSTSSDTSTPKKYDPTKKVISSGNNFAGTSTALTNADLTIIKRVPGLSSVQPERGVAANYVTGPNGDKYLLSLTEYFSDSQLYFASGGSVNNDAKRNEVIIPVSYVSILGFSDESEAVGKTVTIGVQDGYGQQQQVTATVTGVQQKTLTGGGQVIANTPLLNQLYGLQTTGLPAEATDSYSSALAKFDPSISAAQVDSLKQQLKDKGYKAVTIQDQIGVFKQVIKGIIVVLDVFAIIALLAASFGIINTLLMSVQERTKEIGLMKAMGMSSSKIFLLFSAEAILLGFWGSIIGLAVAEVIGRIANHLVTTKLLKDLVGLQLISYPFVPIAEIILLVMVIAFLAGTLPAYRAARQSPIDSLRYE